MGFFDTLGDIAKGAATVGSFIPGPHQPFAAAARGGIGAIEALSGGGAEAATGALPAAGAAAGGGNLGRSLGLGGLGLLTHKMLQERQRQREAFEESANARQELLRRNLGLAERSFAGLQPVRNMGLAGLASAMSGRQSPSAFFGGGSGGGDPFAALGQMFQGSGLSFAPSGNNVLFGSGGQFGAVPDGGSTAGGAGGSAPSPASPPASPPPRVSRGGTPTSRLSHRRRQGLDDGFTRAHRPVRRE